MNIMEMPEIISKLGSLRSDFERRKEDVPFIERCLPVIDAVEEWKYSKSVYFSYFPYENEIEGRSRGRLLKKKYSSPHQAAAVGSYCFGFIGGQHRITIAPAEAAACVMPVSLFELADDVIYSEHTIHYRKATKAPQLRSLSEFFPINELLKANVTVGDRGNFFVYVYEYNALKIPETFHAYSKNCFRQQDCNLFYDEDGELSSVKMGEALIWSKNAKKK